MGEIGASGVWFVPRYFTLFCWVETCWDADICLRGAYGLAREIPTQGLKPTVWVEYGKECPSKVGRGGGNGHGKWQQGSFPCFENLIFELAIFRQHFHFKTNIYRKGLIKRVKKTILGNSALLWTEQYFLFWSEAHFSNFTSPKNNKIVFGLSNTEMIVRS